MAEKVKTVLGCYFLFSGFEFRGHPHFGWTCRERLVFGDDWETDYIVNQIFIY